MTEGAGTPDAASALLGEAWVKLPAALNAAGAATGMNADLAAETVGLFVESGPARWSYEATPTNSLTFASTGGDGVHFGVLTDAGRPGPVVMTVPMNFDRPNVVVGADLRDFLNLGCHFGYFALEQLVYDFEQTVRDIEAAATEERDGIDAVVLATLRHHLGLHGLTGVHVHLDGLRSRYGHHLDGG